MKINPSDVPDGLKPVTREEFYYPKIREQKAIHVTISEIVGTFAQWAIRLSPYVFPERLEEICRFLDEKFLTTLRPTNDDIRLATIDVAQWKNMFDLDGDSGAVDVIEKMFERLLKGNEIVAAWGNPKVEGGTGYSSRYGTLDEMLQPTKYDPDKDWIAIDALIRNVAMELVQGYIMTSRDGYVMSHDGPVKLEVQQPVTNAELGFTETLMGSTVGVVKLEDKTSAIFIGFPTEEKATAAHYKLMDLMIHERKYDSAETAH